MRKSSWSLTALLRVDDGDGHRLPDYAVLHTPQYQNAYISFLPYEGWYVRAKRLSGRGMRWRLLAKRQKTALRALRKAGLR